MANEFLKKDLTALEIKKGKIANTICVLVVIVGIFLCYGFVTGSYAMVGFLFLLNILFGPITLFFYLREVKRGVFRADVEADERGE